MYNEICRRCAGRKSRTEDEGKPCFICHGKGEISLTFEELEEYFKRFRGEESTNSGSEG